jgi:hypothetical protein
MVWRLLSNHDMRRFRRMRRVRPELLRAVHSRLSDEDAADRLRLVVRGDPRAAKATLTYVAEARDHFGGYVGDRAYRVLIAAINDSSVAPIADRLAALFERERALGWTPLESAFNQLAGAVPDLAEIADRCRQGRGSDRSRAAARRAVELVGWRSSHPDPLVRSSLAATVVANYLAAVEGRPSSLDPHHPLWEYARVTIYGKPC